MDAIFCCILLYLLLQVSQTSNSFSVGNTKFEPFVWIFLLAINIFYIFGFKEKFRIKIFLFSLILSPVFYFIAINLTFDGDPKSIQSMVFSFLIILTFIIFPILHILTNIFLVTKSVFIKN